jgi:hypothetical protein
MIKDKVVSVHSMKACSGSRRGTDPLILNFGTRWWSVVTFMLGPIYLLEITLVPTDKEAGWDMGLVWTFWIRQKFVASTGEKKEKRRDGKTTKKT